MPILETQLTAQANIEVPLICGAMYPCSNPELVAAVSEAGGIGIVQPISLTYVHGHEFREGLRLIRRLTAKPIGMNALIEGSSKRYRERMAEWVGIALEEGVRFFITSLGNPRWVCERVHAAGGHVYHDVTERKWALKGRDAGGGRAGPRSAEELVAEVGDLGLPLVCAGGIGDAAGFVAALRMGYAGVQMGTRVIVTTECPARAVYKRGILAADGAQGGPARAVDAPGTSHQALDAHLLRAQVHLAAQALLAGRIGREGLLAGREERRDNHRRRAGGRNRAAVRRGYRARSAFAARA